MLVSMKIMGLQISNRIENETENDRKLLYCILLFGGGIEDRPLNTRQTYYTYHP